VPLLSSSPHPWRVFGVASLATFLAFLDTTIVNVAFPDLLSDFRGAGLGTLAWVINGYALLFAALLAIAGRVADLVGRRRVFLAGIALFVVGSAGAGLAGSPGALIAARFAQGAAAAAMVPSALALLLPVFPPTRRASVVGLWGAVAGVAAAMGPVLGGILVDASGWRLVFWVNVPIGLVAIALGLRMLPESRAEGEQARPDLAGAVLLAAATALVALGLLQANDWGWADGRVIGSWALAVVLAVALVGRSRRHPAPIVEAALWRVRSFSVANGAQFVFGAAFLAAPLVGALLLTGVWGYSTLEAGLAIAPGPLAASVTAIVAGRIADRAGQRAVVIPGTLVYAAGLAWQAAALGSQPDLLGAWLPGQVLAGAGIGLALPALTSAAARSLPPHRFATGVAMSLTSRQLGIVLGIAVIVAVIGTPAPADALDAYRNGLALCAAAGVLAGVVALGLGSGRSAVVASARPAEVTS
jgi:EmrB/QacA subfamily drug resistance transporter